jgi:hypothetical protein
MGKPEGKGPVGRPGLRFKVNIKWIFRKGMVGWTGLIWLRTETGGNGNL